MAFYTSNGNWNIKVDRSVFRGHLRGWLENTSSGNKYIFSIVAGRVRYAKEYKEPTNIPKYLTEYLLSLSAQYEGQS